MFVFAADSGEITLETAGTGRYRIPPSVENNFLHTTATTVLNRIKNEKVAWDGFHHQLFRPSPASRWGKDP